MKVVDSFSFQGIKGFKFGKSLFGVPKLYSHVYFIDGLLIDTGHRRMGIEVLDQIKDLPVKQIFITHHHEDHSGNIALLQNHFDCPVYGSQLCSEMMKSPPYISLSQRMTWGDRPSYHDIKVAGDSIATKNYNFQILDVPGHAKDMVVLYESSRQWLFSADLYVNSYIGYFLKAESMSQQIDSIKKVLELDFDIMLCGHNPQFKGGKAKLEKKLKFLEKFQDDVINEYLRGLTDNEILIHLKLKEYFFIRLISGGALSKLNMVRSVIRDYQDSVVK